MDVPSSSDDESINKPIQVTPNRQNGDVTNVTLYSVDRDGESACDIDDCAFVLDFAEIDNYNEPDTNLLGNGREFNNWKEIEDDANIPGPLETDQYNGLHGVNKYIVDSFTTILHYIFKTTYMD